MHVLIVDDNLKRQAEITIAFMQSGFQTTPTSSQAVAETCIRRGLVDLLFVAERVGGKLTHSLALLAELKNPLVETILLTERTDEDVDELYLLLPSLHCIVAPGLRPDLVIKLAIASLTAAHKDDGPIILPPSMRIDDTTAAPIFASAGHLPRASHPVRTSNVA